MDDSQNARQLTAGEQFEGLNFNPSNNPDVQKVKVAAAAFMDALAEVRPADGPIVTQLVDKASIDLLSAQMFAVKAITWSL